MSTVIPNEDERSDPHGRPLVPARRRRDVFRHRDVWAVYRFPQVGQTAEARCSEFLSVTLATEVADDLNRARTNGQTHYFRVYRLASNLIESSRA